MMPACRIAPPMIFRPRYARAMKSLVPQITEPTGAASPFETQNVTESAYCAISLRLDAQRDGGVEDPGAVHVDRDVAAVGQLGDRLQLVQRHRPAVAGLLHPDQAGPGPVRVVATDRPPDGVDVQAGALLGHGPKLGLGHAGGVRLLGVQGVAGLAADHLVAAPAPGQVGHQVALRAAGDVEAGLLAEQLGGLRLQGVDRGVLAVDVVADLGLEHGAPHLRRWQGNGVAPQVDDAHSASRLAAFPGGAAARPCSPSVSSGECTRAAQTPARLTAVVCWV